MSGRSSRRPPSPSPQKLTFVSMNEVLDLLKENLLDAAIHLGQRTRSPIRSTNLSHKELVELSRLKEFWNATRVELVTATRRSRGRVIKTTLPLSVDVPASVRVMERKARTIQTLWPKLEELGCELLDAPFPLTLPLFRQLLRRLRRGCRVPPEARSLQYIVETALPRRREHRSRSSTEQADRAAPNGTEHSTDPKTSTSRTRAKASIPADLMTTAVVLQRFVISKSTLLRHVKAGTLHSHRPAGAAKNASHRYSFAELSQVATARARLPDRG